MSESAQGTTHKIEPNRHVMSVNVTENNINFHADMWRDYSSSLLICVASFRSRLGSTMLQSDCHKDDVGILLGILNHCLW